MFGGLNPVNPQFCWSIYLQYLVSQWVLHHSEQFSKTTPGFRQVTRCHALAQRGQHVSRHRRSCGLGYGSCCTRLAVRKTHETCRLPPGKRLHNYGKSPCLMGKSTISMAIFNSYFDITRVFRFFLRGTGFLFGKLCCLYPPTIPYGYTICYNPSRKYCQNWLLK